MTRSSIAALALSLVLGAVPTVAEGPAGDSAESRAERQERLQGLRQEIDRLRIEVDRLTEAERGVIGRLDRISAELGLREAEFKEVSLRLDDVLAEQARRTRRLDGLDQAQQRRMRYIELRLNEIYRAGGSQSLRRLLGGDDVERYWSGLRYAAYLNERDLRVLGEYRDDRVALEEETRALEANRRELETSQRELESARRKLESTRNLWSKELRVIRDDRAVRTAAIDELGAAADSLGGLLESFEAEGGATIDMAKLKGLLAWPSRSAVGSGFGTVIHPRFRTEVPHPGLDLDAPMGSDVLNVFDGRIAYAAWMRGYGLTVIVDHGSGLLSIYAHASALLVEVGQQVRRGELLGKVGETGSLRGPYLYFELRLDGVPVDPAEWLRKR